MPVRRLLTIACLTSSLLLLVAIPAWAAGCGPVADLLTCDPVTNPPELVVTPEGWLAIPGADGKVPTPTPQGPVGPPVVDPAGARRLLQLTNQERVAAGLGELTSRPDLVELALEHTMEMVEKDSIFHNLDLLGRPLRSLLGTDVVGENVGWSTDVDDLHRLLMASPGHRASILEPRFNVVGMAVVRLGENRYFATQDFAQAKGGAPAQATPPPAPAAAPSDPVPVTPVVDPVAQRGAPTPAKVTAPAVDPAPSREQTAESTTTTGMSDDTAAEPTELAVGEVGSIVGAQPVSAEVPGPHAALVALAMILAALVALANGASLYRDRNRDWA